MGRKKIQIGKLESEANRKATYGKRSKGLTKKAKEISVLSGVDVALIMFSCSGKLDQFSSQPGIWKILQRFIHNIPDNERRLISLDNINTINMLAEQHEYANQYREVIKEEIIDNDVYHELLELRNIIMQPSREAFKSQQQFAGLLHSLENVRQTVVNRRVQMQMQQMQVQEQFHGQQHFMGPDQILLPVKIEPVSVDVQTTDEQRGSMDLFGGVQMTDEQLYDSAWWNEMYDDAIEPDGAA